MSEEPARRTLGRGLSALLGPEEEPPGDAAGPRTLPIEFLAPSPFQPRRRFDEAELRLLADSIREKGVLQPILVRRAEGRTDRYEIVAGERRWRAAQMAGLHEVPVVLRALDDREALEVALVENVQRQDLSPLEEAEGYRRLLEEFGHTQDQLAQRIGKSRSHIANSLRLLGLPEAVKAMLESGQLSAGHARALVNAADPAALARAVVAKGLNVRQAERLAQAAKAGDRGGRAPRREKDPDTLALERDLSSLLGLKVTIAFDGQGGTLAIHYKTVEQLDEVLDRLSRSGAPAAV